MNTIFALAILIAQTITRSDPIPVDQTAKGANPLKIIRYCGKQLADCLVNQDCAKTLLCFKNCPLEDNDCTNRCFFENSNLVFITLSECMMKNDCLPDLSFSQTNCPRNIRGKSGLIQDIFLKNNVGKYFVARGWNRGYDCADCQKLVYNGVFGSDQGLETHWSSEINGKVKMANNSLVQDSPGSMMTKYKLFGMDVEEHYYLLDWTTDGSWIMFYYCGYGFNREYQGALLLARDYDFDVLPESVQIKFDNAILMAGLGNHLGPLKDWCQPKFTERCKHF